MPRIYPLPSGQTRSYVVNLTDLSTSNFYPCVFSVTANTYTAPKNTMPVDAVVKSQGGSASAAWNQNFIHFEANNGGWGDNYPKYLNVYAYGVYDANELTIGTIGFGNQSAGFVCIWLRGGLDYRITSNCVPKVYPEGFTSGGETVTVGTSLHGGTNTNVSNRFTPDGTSVFLTKY